MHIYSITMANQHNNNSNEYTNIELFDTIDLHYFHPRDIKSILEEFINNAIEKGYMRLEIIHGKGKSVNKTIVHNYCKKDPRVKAFFDKPGNWGITIVIL
ncbi:MAG: Smr/MutS family protein [Spirochaetes bacterium]|nr:Smr/MutS family protein [Spirochaetota bacterium]